MKKFRNDSEYLRDFFEHAPIGFHAFGPDRVIIDMNQAELDMLGYSREEVIGKKCWTDFIDPSEASLFERHWKVINAKGQVRNLQYTLVCRDGRRLNVLLNASARFDAAGKLVNTRGSVVDISERRRMARTLAASRQKLGRHRLALEKNNLILVDRLDKWEEEKSRLQNNIRKNIEDTIFPLLEKLKRRGSPLDQRNLTLLDQYLQDLTSGFGFRLMDKKWRLSIREIEICKMLKNGLKTRDIADLLCTSSRTIEHHRSNIRKKLKIDESSSDLTEYLKAFVM